MTETVKAQPKRLIILDAINAGGATRESLMAAADCSAASFGTNCSYLRLGGHYPIKDEDGIFRIISKDEWDVIQEEKRSTAKARKTSVPKTPEELLMAAEKRAERTAKALTTATTRVSEYGDEVVPEVVSLRHTIASAEARLAELNLEGIQDSIGESSDDSAGEMAEDAETTDVLEDELV